MRVNLTTTDAPALSRGGLSESEVGRAELKGDPLMP